MIKNIMRALTEKDSVSLAKCFSENCMYFDYCPSLNDIPNSYVYGNACMEMFFKTRFVSGEFEVAEPLIENQNCASFFGAYGGPYIYARLNIEEYDSYGLVKKAVVHPA